MQNKFRLYRRFNGTFYAEDRQTGARTSLGTKTKADAEHLLRAKNESVAQPAFNREMAKVYLRAQDPALCSRTWQDVAELIDAAYEGATKKRFAKFLKSEPMTALKKIKLIATTADDLLDVLTHPSAGVSTNVQLRILHNRALDLGWILQPALSRKAWPALKYGKRRAITPEEHEKILALTKREDFRTFLQLCWETGGSQTDIASLEAADIDWSNRRLYYERVKLARRDQGRACIAIGLRLDAVLKQLPKSGPLFPRLHTMSEGTRSAIFWKLRRAAGVKKGVVLHSYRYAWAERAQQAGMPEREAMAHLGHGSKAVHRAYARAADRVTMPLEWYESQASQKLVDFRAAVARSVQTADNADGFSSVAAAAESP
jgi:integrase